MSDEPSLHEFVDWIGEKDCDYPVVCMSVYYSYTKRLDDDLVTVIDKHRWDMIPEAVEGTVDYLEGRVTRRGVAGTLDVDAIEGIALTQAIERVARVVGDVDPDLHSEEFEVRLSRDDGPFIRLAGESEWIVSPEELREGDYAEFEDVNERVREEWVEDTTPVERVRSIMSRTYEAQSASTIADRAHVSEGVCRWHLDMLAENGFVEKVEGEDEDLYRRAPESVVRERAEQLLDDVDVETLEERVEELREVDGVTPRRNLHLAEAALEIVEEEDV